MNCLENALRSTVIGHRILSLSNRYTDNNKIEDNVSIMLKKHNIWLNITHKRLCNEIASFPICPCFQFFLLLLFFHVCTTYNTLQGQYIVQGDFIEVRQLSVIPILGESATFEVLLDVELFIKILTGGIAWGVSVLLWGFFGRYGAIDGTLS